MTALPYLLACALLGAWIWDEVRIDEKLSRMRRADETRGAANERLTQ